MFRWRERCWSHVRINSPRFVIADGWASSSRRLMPPWSTEQSRSANRSLTRVSVVFTCCPPGPPDRLNSKVRSEAGITSPGLISSDSSVGAAISSYRRFASADIRQHKRSMNTRSCPQTGTVAHPRRPVFSCIYQPRHPHCSQNYSPLVYEPGIVPSHRSLHNTDTPRPGPSRESITCDPFCHCFFFARAPLHRAPTNPSPPLPQPSRSVTFDNSYPDRDCQQKSSR